MKKDISNHQSHQVNLFTLRPKKKKKKKRMKKTPPAYGYCSNAVTGVIAQMLLQTSID